MKDLDRNEALILDRRSFTVQSALALLSGVAITLTGCGRIEGDGSPTAPSTSSDRSGAVSNNHGHVAVITGAQLMAGNAVSLNIQGNAGHPHIVELTAGETMQIAGGQRMSKESSSDQAHRHTVTFN